MPLEQLARKVHEMFVLEDLLGWGRHNKSPPDSLRRREQARVVNMCFCNQEPMVIIGGKL
jgi:hypothetical protein